MRRRTLFPDFLRRFFFLFTQAELIFAPPLKSCFSCWTEFMTNSYGVTSVQGSLSHFFAQILWKWVGWTEIGFLHGLEKIIHSRPIIFPPHVTTSLMIVKGERVKVNPTTTACNFGDLGVSVLGTVFGLLTNDGGARCVIFPHFSLPISGSPEMKLCL